MQFFTQVPLSASKKPIDYQSKILSVGSCFAENIGEKLHFYKFQSSTNPFGIIFNPVSIEKLISRAVLKKFFTEKDIFFHNESWHCFDVHSELSHPDKELFLNTLNNKLMFFRDYISSATHFIITLGTSWVYKSILTAEIAANCHKVPQKQFSKHLLSASENIDSIKNSVGLVKEINPNCSLIFTISPVRHLKDGFIENQNSKANLISAVYDVIQKDQNNLLSYFPSYEILMDELRDYRFYSNDLLHPNTTAIDYIWLRFIESTINETTLATMSKVETIQKGLQHRPFHPESNLHQKFLENLKEKIEHLQKEYAFMKF